MKWVAVGDYDDLSRVAARIMLDALAANPLLVLGLPTGRTPEGMYARLVTECARDYRCFRDVVTFNLDEYVGIAGDHPGSYSSYMRRHLVGHVDIDPQSVHIPDGLATRFRDRASTADEALEMECEDYERSIREEGPIDLLYLGLGRNGHIGFNEPGTLFDSKTHVIQLSESTRNANAALFPDGNVPQRAITMGIGTILAARRVILLASGESKREAVRRLHKERENTDFPASALRGHPDVMVICDQETV